MVNRKFTTGLFLTLGLIAFTGGFSAWAEAGSVSDGDAEQSPLISVQRGGIPVVLSSPHDGGTSVEGGEEKNQGTKVRDLHTAEVTRLVAEFLEERLEAKPYYVVAEFSRRYADANRGPGLRPEEAYSCPQSQVHYDAYHRALREAVDDIRQNFGGGLLVDIHGQSARRGHIIRGTVNGETVSAMLEAHGLEALIGPQSLFGHLAESGYKVEPPVRDAPDSPADEEIFIGGYIVRAYGSHQGDGIDSIQVELGRDYRQSDVRRQTARDLADAIAIYLETYVLDTAVAN